MSCFHLCTCVVITLPVAQSAPPQTRDTAQPYQREKHGWPGSHKEPSDPWGRCPPYKVLRMCNGDIGGWIWLLFPSMTAPQKEKKKKKVKITAPVSKLQSDDSQCSEVPEADTRPFLLSTFLKVNLQLPSTWLQSCLPLSESQLHRRGAVPVKAVIFHTQTHASMHLHRCAVHTHTHRHTPAAATLPGCGGRHE